MRSMLGMMVWLLSMPLAAYAFDAGVAFLEWHMVTKAIVFSYLSVGWFVFLQTWRFDFTYKRDTPDFQGGNHAYEDGMIIKFPGDKRKAQ